MNPSRFMFRDAFAVLTLITVGLLAPLPVAAQGSALDYPQWRGPDRDGSAAAFVEPTEWPEQLSQQWRNPTRPGERRAAIAGAAQSRSGPIGDEIEGGRAGCPRSFPRRDRPTNRDTAGRSGLPAQTPPTPKPQSQLSGVIKAPLASCSRVRNALALLQSAPYNGE